MEISCIGKIRSPRHGPDTSTLRIQWYKWFSGTNQGNLRVSVYQVEISNWYKWYRGSHLATSGSIIYKMMMEEWGKEGLPKMQNVIVGTNTQQSDAQWRIVAVTETKRIQVGEGIHA